MSMILFVGTLVLALPLAVAAFVMGNFAVLTALCVYSVAACLAVIVVSALNLRAAQAPPSAETTSSRRASTSPVHAPRPISSTPRPQPSASA